MNFTKQQISDLFYGIPTWKSYEDLSTEMSTVDQEITLDMLQELFRANGHNLRNRPRKPNVVKSWFTIIDQDVQSPVETEELVLLRQ